MSKNKFVGVSVFDSRYLSRGLVMYESLIRQQVDFILYIIAFDDRCYDKLNELQLKDVIVIPLNEFEDKDLLKVKKQRTRGEYCWTCSSKSILYILERYGEKECTYIDADLCFFHNPADLIEELESKDSVLITEHRYSDYCDQSKTSGKYCVQFVTIRNNEIGMKVLKWWTERCIEWCYNRVENGKFGDQKYLDEWCEQFDGVHELQNLGGVAPWNANQFIFSRKNNKIYLRKHNTDENIPLVFYHFHGLTFFDKDVVQLAPSGYSIPDSAVTNIYKEYIALTAYVCEKYYLYEEQNIWLDKEHFRDDKLDELMHTKNYYQYSLLV